MWHIVGIVFKIIGILLLIVLAVILLILLAPLSYRFSLSKYEDIQADGKISWLFHIITAVFSYRDGQFTVVFRIFGKRFGGSKKKPLAKEKEDSDKEMVFLPAKKEETDDIPYETVQSAQAAVAKKEEKPVSNEDFSKSIKEINSVDEQNFQKQESSGLWEKLTQQFLRIKHFLLSLFKKIKNLMKKVFRTKENIAAVWEFGHQQEVREFLGSLWQKSKKLIKHLLPTKVSGRIHFGFENPANTGQVLGLISMFYAWYYKKIEVEPDFDTEILEGEIQAKGSILTGHLLILIAQIVYKIWRNKEIISKWRQIDLKM